MKFPTILLLIFAILFSNTILCAEEGQRQLGQFLLEGVPDLKNGLGEMMRQYLAVRPTVLQSISDNGGSILISTRSNDTLQLHVVNHPMGARQQITFYDQPVLGAFFVPGSGERRLIFSRDIDGKENWQLYLLDRETGRADLLTDGRSRHESPVVSSDGRFLAFCGSGRNGEDFDVYLRDLARGGVSKPLLRTGGMLIPLEFSPDNSKLLVQKYISERETHLFVIDIANGAVTGIVPPSPAIFYGGGAWAPDGKAIYLISDRDGEFRKLYKVSLESSVWKCLTPDIEWDVEEVKVDWTRKGIVFTTNEDGVNSLYFSDLEGSSRRFVRLPQNTIKINGLTHSHNGHDEFGFTLTGSRTPSDAYTVTFPTGEIKRWTQSETGGLSPNSFSISEMIRYPTFDKSGDKPRMIPAFIFRGRGKGPRPVIIHVHGGPEFQYQPVFNSDLQYWANELGITVISPNVRGSTGYGRSFHQLDNDVKREDAVRDIGALLGWINRQPDLDAGRVGIFGGSYGGFLVLSSLMNYADRIGCGIDVAGVADITGFLENTSGYRRDLRRAEYGDERDPQVRKTLDRISPLHHVNKIEAALFVVHGKKDTRVPIHDAEQIVTKMREMKRSVWFAKALDEGHSFQKKVNRDMSSIMYVLFWEKYLLNRKTTKHYVQ